MRAFIFIVALLNIQPGFCQAYKTTREEQTQIQEVVQGCIQAKKRDQICDYLIVFQQVGTDAIELIKEYAHLGSSAYTLLTLANFAATGRLRFKTGTFFDKKGHFIYDIQRDLTMVYYEREF